MEKEKIKYRAVKNWVNKTNGHYTWRIVVKHSRSGFTITSDYPYDDVDSAQKAMENHAKVNNIKLVEEPKISDVEVNEGNLEKELLRIFRKIVKLLDKNNA